MEARAKAVAILMVSAVFSVATSFLANAEGHPARVVSMNVCTDQLAMMLAQPGQLHSVSWLAADPTISVLADRADGLVLNHGLAEEIFLMKPDLIIAGTFTTRATVAMLRRLGFRVEEFAPANSFDDIRTNIARMGDLLGNRAKAENIIETFDADLAEMKSAAARPEILALYFANSYTSGTATLADALVDAARLRNLGGELGYTGTVKLPLEVLVAHRPDIVAGRERDFGAPAKAEETFAHPAYHAIANAGRGMTIESRYWVCGTPYVLEAARRLADHAERLAQGNAGDE